MKFAVPTLALFGRNLNARAVIPLMNCEYRRSDRGVTGLSPSNVQLRGINVSVLSGENRAGTENALPEGGTVRKLSASRRKAWSWRWLQTMLLQHLYYTHLSITDGWTGCDPNRKKSKFERNGLITSVDNPQARTSRRMNRHQLSLLVLTRMCGVAHQTPASA
jgi:hypothetical protein